MASKKKDDGENQSDTANAADEPVVVAGISSPTVQRADAPFSTRQQLMPSAAPNSQMVKVKEVATGRVFAAWPIDARELVTHPKQEHVYATAEEELTPRGDGGVFPNPVPVAPMDATSPVGVDPVPPITPPREGARAPIDPLTAADRLGDMSKAELQDLATKANVDPNQTKADLVEALHPHVTAGTVALPGAAGAPVPLAPPPPKPR